MHYRAGLNSPSRWVTRFSPLAEHCNETMGVSSGKNLKTFWKCSIWIAEFTVGILTFCFWCSADRVLPPALVKTQWNMSCKLKQEISRRQYGTLPLSTHTRKYNNNNCRPKVKLTLLVLKLYACEADLYLNAYMNYLTDKNWYPHRKCKFKDSGQWSWTFFLQNVHCTVYTELQIQGWIWGKLPVSCFDVHSVIFCHFQSRPFSKVWCYSDAFDWLSCLNLQRPTSAINAAWLKHLKMVNSWKHSIAV